MDTTTMRSGAVLRRGGVGVRTRRARSIENWRGGTVNGSYINFDFKFFRHFRARAHAGVPGYAEQFVVFE